ncbi:MAG TPA: alanine dehydrogenase [Candidatus Acidoferrales bacterium]|nr:alanine dehydrogenase [Candidatus Acidoferrales bacterium]
MNIGIPNEFAKHENRVSLTPSAVATLVHHSHTVYVETGAGKLSRFGDEAYRKAGATVVYSKDEVFRRCELVCSVEAPKVEEIDMMEHGQTTFSFLNLPVAKPQLIESVLQKKINMIGYEFVETEDGDRPVVHSMSEIAGQLSIFISARLLETDNHGRGIILGGAAGIAPAAVVILGAGVVGTEAARTAVGLGAQAIVLDRDIKQLRKVDQLLMKRVTTALVTPVNVKKSVAYADVLIGAVSMRGERTPHVVTEEMVKSMKPGAVIVDVSIDQGGCVETSRPTTLQDPVFVLHDVIHYCVPNITGAVARTATYALTNTILPYVIEIALKGVIPALKEDRGLARGVCAFDGHFTQERAAKIFGKKFEPIEGCL